MTSPTLFQSLIPIIFLIILLSFNVYYFGDDTLSGANQIALLLSAALAGLIAFSMKIEWDKTKKIIINSIGSAMPSILILLLIGSLAGTWLISGVVPAMVYYGLNILHPSIFLIASIVICAIVSIATGSSWSTIATIGIALLGIGEALELDKGIVAGAIISGAYFGDKMSPLSDTTNLAPAMAGTDIFTHIRYMLYTTIPTIIITLLIFSGISFFTDFSASETNALAVQKTIETSFNINPALFLVPLILLIVIVKKVPPIPSLLIGTLLGGIFAIIFQPKIIYTIAGDNLNYAEAAYITFMKSMFGEVSIKTDNDIVNNLLSTGGMAGMMNSIWLILSAMVFGGVMEAAGFLAQISKRIIKLAKSTGALVTSTVASCLFFNITASDQYISIVVPGRMYASAFKNKGLKPEVLSRTLEDSATVTSVLIPWNTCGATQATVLGVPTLTYLPYAFFNILSPFVSILMAWLNIKIRRQNSD